MMLRTANGMIVAAYCLNAVAAHAEETVCKGTRYVMEDGIAVTQDVDSDTAKTCIAWHGTKAFAQINDFCSVDTDRCAFTGHVTRTEGNSYFIDQIISRIKID
jgi:hypothetical protein